MNVWTKTYISLWVYILLACIMQKRTIITCCNYCNAIQVFFNTGGSQTLHFFFRLLLILFCNRVKTFAEIYGIWWLFTFLKFQDSSSCSYSWIFTQHQKMNLSGYLLSDRVFTANYTTSVLSMLKRLKQTCVKL